MGDDLSEAELDLLQSTFDWAREGDTARLTEFFDIGGPANLTNSKGDTLLILATYHNHPASVHALLARGADVERVNDAGQTALAAAVFRRSAELVTLLLEAGADPDAGPKSARTVATFFDLPDMVALLPPPKG